MYGADPVNLRGLPTADAGGLADAFSRRIDYLRISVTDRCNLKCVYCMPSQGLRPFPSDEVLTNGEISAIVEAAQSRGLRKVRITGGEPLLRPDLLPLIADLKLRIGIREVSLTTNGTRLAALARELASAGLDRVNISLDTMDPDRFRAITRGGSLESVWEAVAKAEEAGLLPIKLNVVPLRGMNDDEIEAFALLTLEKDYHVRFIEYMPMNGGSWRREACVPTGEIRQRVSALGELEPLPFRGCGPSRNYRLRGARGVIGFISPLSDHFCGWCNRLRLTARGMLRPCLFSDVEVDLRSPLRNGASRETLGLLVGRAAAAKPRGHALHADEERLANCGSMAQIGG